MKVKILCILAIILMSVCSWAVEPFATPDRVLDVYKAPAVPTIDGLEDSLWQSVEAIGVTRVDTSSEFSILDASDDYGGWFKLLWDEENLYVFVNVMDDYLLFDESSDDDKVELFFDADASIGLTEEEYNDQYSADYGTSASWWFGTHDGHTQTYDLNTSQWVLQIDSEAIETGTQGPGLSWGLNRFPTDGIQSAVVITDFQYGYAMEFAFPWESLNADQAFAAGQEIGFNIQINDYDIETERGLYSWIMDYVNANWCDPTVFGKLVLNEMTPPERWVLKSPKAGIAPVIDGEKDEIWEYAMPHAITIGDTDTEYWELLGAVDYMGMFRVMWDETNIYLLFEVTDDMLLSSDGSDDDKVEIFFDAYASEGITLEEYEDIYASDYGAAASWWFGTHDGHTQTYDESTSQWIYQIDSEAIETGTQGPGLSWGQDRFPSDDIQTAFAELDSRGYVMEMAFPYESLLGTGALVEGQQLGFNAQINDFDYEGERAFYNWMMRWANANWCDPTAFGILELASISLLGEETAVEEHPVELATDLTLAQNYPNPFNPTTTIEFTLPNAADVNLSVFNLRGEMVAELADGQYSAGLHTLMFDGSNLSSGIYFYKLTTPNQTVSRSLMLIK